MQDLDRYLIDEYDQDVEDLASSEKRLAPISVKNVKGKSIITILENTITQWKPRDLRLERSYIESHPDVEDISEELLVDVAKGMSLKVEKRNIKSNSIDIAVLFQHNLAEFERYDTVVEKHNEKWLEAGEPEDIFDPKNGDIIDIKDRFVTPSRYDGVNPFGESSGELTKAKPKTKRKKYITLSYYLNIQKDVFILGYCAKDLANKILYYNETSGNNLAALVRRSIQEFFGNHEVYDNIAPFYDGIPMLINGRKLKYCAKNKKPRWLNGKIKDIAIPLAIKAAKVSVYKTAGNMVRYIGMISGVIGIIGYILYAMNKAYDTNVSVTQYAPDAISVWQVLIVISLILVVMYIMVLISGWLNRKAYNEEIESKFL